MWPFDRRETPASTNPIAQGAEQKSGLSDPEQWLYDLFTGTATGAVLVSDSQALSVPAVMAAIRTVSEACATLDIRVIHKDGDTEKDDTEHPVAKLLQGDVNEWTSGFEFIRDLVSQALTSDAGGLAWVNRIDGKPIEIVHYNPGSIAVQLATNGTREPSYRLNGIEIDRASIIHLRGAFSKCPLSMAREAISAAWTMEKYASRLFSGMSAPGGVIEFPEDLSKEQIKKVREAWIATHGGPENAGKPAVLFDGAKWKQSTLNSTDAQYLETRKFQNLQIARAFKVPPSMLFELDRATWGNSEQMGYEFLIYCLEPWLQALESALSRGLFTPEERNTYRVSFDRDDLTRASLTERATAISSLISSKVINPNEGRDWIGLAPYPAGSEFANPHINVQPTPKPVNDNKPGKDVNGIAEAA